MISPEVSVDLIVDALNVQPLRSKGAGRAVMIVPAHAEDSAVPVAHAVAHAVTAGSVYAIDLDARRNGLARSLAADGETLGPRIDGALNGASLWAVFGAHGRVVANASPYVYHRLGRSHIFVGAMDPRQIPRGGGVAITAAPTYWNAVRAGGATAVVCAPALSNNEIALRVARHMDGVVLLVGVGAGAAPAALAAKSALDRADANVMGLVYAGATRPVMALERLRRQIA